MNQAWKSINGLIVSSTSNLDQLKISFYTEIKKKKDLMICVTRHDFLYQKEWSIFIHPFQEKQMESLLTIADNLEPWLRRINMRHRIKTWKS